MPPHLSNSRFAAARILQSYTEHGVMPERHLRELVQDRAFITEMVLGVVRHQLSLDWWLGQLMPRGVPTGRVRPVLWVGLYQIMLMDAVEPYAAVYETVQAAKVIGTPRHAPLVNAVLRRALRERQPLLDALHQQPPTVRFSHPPELFDRWKTAFGEADTLRLCVWNNTRPHVYLRVRPQWSPDDTLHQLQRCGVPAALCTARPEFITLQDNVRVEKVPGFAVGQFMVHDPATMRAVDLLDPQPGEAIADVCAAPGGKAIAIADRLQGRGLWVGDINLIRSKRLQANLRRCGYAAIPVHAFNAVAEPLPQEFDGILLDAPCSNTGVIRRRPDARYRLNADHLAQLNNLQLQMLDNVAHAVRPGGRLVYSTCSLEAEENEDLIRRWLPQHPDFQLEATATCFPPHDHIDGAYTARLRRRAG